MRLRFGTCFFLFRLLSHLRRRFQSGWSIFCLGPSSQSVSFFFGAVAVGSAGFCSAQSTASRSDFVGYEPVWSSLQGRTDAAGADAMLDARLPEICLVSPQFPGLQHSEVCGDVCKSRYFADVALLKVCTGFAAGAEWRSIRRCMVRDHRDAFFLTAAAAEEWANQQPNVLIQTVWSAQADLCREAGTFLQEFDLVDADASSVSLRIGSVDRLQGAQEQMTVWAYPPGPEDLADFL